MRSRRHATYETWHAHALRRSRRAFATTIAAMTVGLVVGPGLGAVAQEATEPTPLEAEKRAYYTNSAGAAIPDILVEEFPPGLVCIVRPEACSEDARQITGPIDEALPPPETAPNAPVQPVEPGSIPTGRFGGAPRYVSAYKFALPPVPAGQEFSRFQLVLTEQQPTYTSNSPAFRQVVLAVLASIQQGQIASEEFQKAFTEREPVNTQIMDVEVCAAAAPFDDGENQSWDARPETDCIFGANGTRNDDGTWTFDLTFAAQAWADGTLPNEGIVIAPTAANNFAYGDPETTDIAQVTFAGPESDSPPAAIIEYAAATETTTTPLPPPSSSSGASDGGSSSSGFSGGQSADVFSSSPAFGTESTPPAFDAAPQVAEPPAAPEAAAPAPQVAAPTLVAGSQAPMTPWWVWSIVPIGLAGMFAVARSLTAEPVLATERAGAMTRLIEMRAKTQASPSAGRQVPLQV